MAEHILITNDDGVFAPGLFALVEKMRNLGKVTVLAPTETGPEVDMSRHWTGPYVSKRSIFQMEHRPLPAMARPRIALPLQHRDFLRSQLTLCHIYRRIRSSALF
jgi:hypothetical protein